MATCKYTYNDTDNKFKNKDLMNNNWILYMNIYESNIYEIHTKLTYNKKLLIGIINLINLLWMIVIKLNKHLNI